MKKTAVWTACWLALSLAIGGRMGFTWQALVSSAVTLGSLYAAASTSRVLGAPLFWLAFALYAGIGVINIQIDVALLKIAPTLTILRHTALGLVQAAAVAAAVAFVMASSGRPPVTSSRPELATRLWLRVPATALLYLVLYLMAGAMVLPFIQSFYQGTSQIVIPPLPILFGVTAIRGLVYVAAIAPFLRQMSGRRVQAGVVAGLCLGVLGGVAPLVLPNEILPVEIRLFHMVEVFCENFVFGMASAYLLVRRASKTDAD